MRQWLARTWLATKKRGQTEEDSNEAFQRSRWSEYEKEVHDAYRRGGRDTLVFLVVIIGLSGLIFILAKVCGGDPTI